MLYRGKNYKRFITSKPINDNMIPIIHFTVSFSLKNIIDINDDRIRLAPWFSG